MYIYIGISAGTIITTPSLVLSKAEKEPVKEIGESIYDQGLGLVDFLVEPHINNKYFPELTFKYAEKNSQKIHRSVYALDDKSAIKVNEGKIQVVSEGEWKKFN